MTKRRIIGNAIMSVLNIVAIVTSTVCFIYGFTQTGVIILGSFLIMDVCYILIMLQDRRLSDKSVMTSRGKFLRRFRCDCEYTSDSLSENYENGHIVFYENGITYEYDSKEYINYIGYNEISAADLNNGVLSLQLNGDNRISLQSGELLRMKMIVKYLLRQNIEPKTAIF